MISAHELFGRVPFNRWLGGRLLRSDAEGAELVLEPRPEFLQEGDAVQGGLLASLADTAAAYALVPTLHAGETMTAVEFKLNFLRPARLERGELRARASVRRRGRRIGVAEVEILQAGHAVAAGLFTFLFLPRGEGGHPHPHADGAE